MKFKKIIYLILPLFIATALTIIILKNFISTQNAVENTVSTQDVNSTTTELPANSSISNLADMNLSYQERINMNFKEAGFNKPPKEITLITYKQEKIFELWGKKDSTWILIKEYPVLAASGKIGPKLKEGDKQVPEGIYKIIGMNPKSTYHLSMLINYPNEFDKKNAAIDNRDNLGGEICIHGKDVSAGCVAIGDPGIEEVYNIVKTTGLNNVKVLISPHKLKDSKLVEDIRTSNLIWINELYINLEKELVNYKK